MGEVPASFDASHLRIGIAVSTFNAVITDGLLAGALDALKRAGAEDPTVVRVPGAFELPVVSRAFADAGYDCVVALGAVIEGETDHYEHVATQASAGLREVAVATGVPVALGVLTVRDAEQARARSLPGAGNKGAEAAEGAVIAANAIRAIRGG